uniref:Zona pellucida sperm-binding protein 4 n=1 Tax=Salmo trutta TaxID=8032 RepID=A0A673Z4I5_SALTR
SALKLVFVSLLRPIFATCILLLFSQTTSGCFWISPLTSLDNTQQTPQRPVIQGPQLQTPQRPEPQWPQLQTPQRSEAQRPAVNTTPDQRCQVQVQDTVQCGTPDITPSQCQAINCCFNGQQCYYGKAVTVQCTRDGQFVVVVARDATSPKIDIDSISLLGGNDSPCSPVGITLAFAIYQFPVTACGTTLKEESGYVVYENRMASSYNVRMGPRGSITRDSHFELLFQCKYSATAVEALVIEVNTVPAPAPVAAPGPLRVELRLAKGTCDTKGCNDGNVSFTLYYTEEEYPITKVLRQPVNVEVRILERKDPNLFLMLEHCWTTSAPSPASMPQWDLIIEDCSYPNDNYLTTMVPVERSSGLLYPNHYKRFTLEMFTFADHTLSPQKDRIFIHCSTSVCYPAPGVSCEPKCNRQRRDVAAAQRKTIQTAVVSSGEVVLVDKKPV